MQTLILTLAAAGLYLLAAARYAAGLFHPGDSATRPRTELLAIGLAAAVLHAWVLYPGIVTPDGLELGFFNAASLIAWVIVVILLAAALARPLENLAVVLLPIAALTLVLALALPSGHVLPPDSPAGLQIHVLISIAAYSVLAIAAFQAIGLAIQHRLLRGRRPGPVIKLLPPLQVMEDLLFQLIGLGFFLLSLGLVSGLMFLEDMFAQHIAHKTVLSFVAWAVFATLLWGRWRSGWRGRTAIRWTLGGFVALMLAYFGSKLVLELILGRY